MLPGRLIHSAFELQDIADGEQRPLELIERDFALVTIAAHLTASYGGELCFKGGFVLRHAYGHTRFSQDLDATKTNPPKHKLDAEEVASTIVKASAPNLLRLKPAQPTTDSGRSLDFEHIAFDAATTSGVVSVEISYREGVIDEPLEVDIGHPFYEPFKIPVLTLNETVAEKLRTLAQRDRPTDLADLALILGRDAERLDAAHVRELAAEKFKLVKQGDVGARIEDRIDRMGSGYAAAVPGLAPDAPPFAEARETVVRHLHALLP